MIRTQTTRLRTNIRRLLLAALLMTTVLLGGCGHGHQPAWRLTDVSGHLPDLRFNLTDDHGKPVEGRDYHGKLALMYFGYTHCPDVCPLTLTRLHVVLQRLGAQADKVRILFISVDPARDTPAILHAYVNAFDKHAVGLVGTQKQTEVLAKRYRVAFSDGKARADGNYDVNHSSAIYVFDAEGHARLLATPLTSNDDMVHDLTLLLATDP